MKRKKKKSTFNGVPPRGVRHFFAELGSGLITGAADDDPSGISTYSVTGASFGYAPLWTPTLHAQGKTSIDTAQQAAEALKPVAGNGAYLPLPWD